MSEKSSIFAVEKETKTQTKITTLSPQHHGQGRKHENFQW